MLIPLQTHDREIDRWHHPVSIFKRHAATPRVNRGRKMEKKSKSVRTFLFFFLTRNVKTKKMVSNIGQSDTTATSPLGGKFPNGRSSSSSVLLLYNSPTLNSTTRVADALRIKRGLETHHGSCCSAATPCTRFYLMNRAATHHGSGTRPLESQHFFFFFEKQQSSPLP